MRALPFLVVISAACALSACVTYVTEPKPVLLTDATTIASITKIKHDEFKKITVYEGANATLGGTQNLRAIRDDATGLTEYQIYRVSTYTKQWRFYSEAYDDSGAKLDFKSIDKSVTNCSSDYECYYHETVGIKVTRDYLDRKAESGIRYKISGQAGEEVNYLPAAYVKGFLTSIDRASGAFK